MKRLVAPLALMLCAACCSCAPKPPPSASLSAEPDAGGEAPTILYLLPDTSGRQRMAALALSEDYVNFAVWWGGVYRVPKFGGQALPIEEDPSSFFRYIGARAATVAWVRAPYDAQGASLPPSLKAQTIGQDAVSLLELGDDTPASTPFIPALQVTATNVYFNDNGSTIDRIALDGGTATTIALPGESGRPDWLADDSFVYFLSSRFKAACALSRIAVGGGAAQELAACPTAAREPWLVGIDATDVYVGGAGGIWRVPQEGGGAAVRIYAPPGADVVVSGLSALDDQTIFFVRSAGADPILTSIPKTGGAATTVWDGVRGGLGDVAQLAQDGPSLFTLHPWGIQVFKKPN